MSFNQEVRCTDCMELLGYVPAGQCVAIVQCPSCKEMEDKYPDEEK